MVVNTLLGDALGPGQHLHELGIGVLAEGVEVEPHLARPERSRRRAAPRRDQIGAAPRRAQGTKSSVEAHIPAYVIFRRVLKWT